MNVWSTVGTVCMLLFGVFLGICVNRPEDGTPLMATPVDARSAADSGILLNCNQEGQGHFMPNRGQIADSSVLFHTTSAYFTPTGAIFRSRGTVGDDGFAVYRLEFLGANKVCPEGVSPVPSSTNFYLGNNPSRWAVGVPAYDQLVYRNLYESIDLVFRADPCGLKYDLLVHPGGRPSDIRLGYQGAEARTDGTKLVLATPAGTVREAPVMAYQLPGTVPVEARMTVKDNVVSYEVPHDPGRELVIDPLIYSTYIGGSNYDREPAMALDGSSNAYLAGQTESLDFPVTPGSYSGSKSDFADAYILKLDKTGSTLAYSTYVGGNGYDCGSAIALDSSGNAYVAGYTSSTDFPTTSGSFSRASSGGQDVFVLRLGPSGDQLLCSTYVGGTGNDYAEDLAIDNSGKAFVGGRTYSKDLPTTSSAYQRSYLGGNTDLFMLKLNAAMSALDYCTYLGGRWDDTLYSMTVDRSGNAYVTGSADSDNFPATTGAYDTTRDGDDAYALALDSSGGGLLFSTFYGGTGSESGRDISLDDSGNIYLAGNTYSRDLPTTEGALFRMSNDFNNGDAFVAKFDPDASDLLYSTYLGGKGNDEGRAVTPGKLGGITVLGGTASADFPVTEGCYDANYHDWTDAFLVRINATGASLDYSTYIGGSDGDYASSLALDSSGCMYAAGYTYSRDFPTTAGSFQTASAGGSDLFAFKMSLPPAPGTPQNLSALGLDGRVALSWARPGGDVVWNYTLWKGASESGLSVYRVLPNVTAFEDTAVQNGKAYYYALSASNPEGQSGRTAAVNATPGRVPDAPVNVTATGSNDSVRVEWGRPANDGGFPVRGYRILRGTTSESLSVVAEPGNVTSFDDPGLEPGHYYFYEVASFNALGENLSEMARATVGAPPGAPRNLTASAGSETIVLFWEAPEDTGGFPVDRYDILVGLDPESFDLLDTATGISYEHRWVSRGVTYYYEVSAKNRIGAGEPSTAVSARIAGDGGPGPVPPWPPENLAATVESSGVRLDWLQPSEDGGSAVTGYVVYKGSSAGELSRLAVVTSAGYLDRAVSANATYYYSVSAVNTAGEGERCPAVRATVPPGPARPGPPVNLSAIPGEDRIFLAWEPPGFPGDGPVMWYAVSRGTTPVTLSFLSNSTAKNFTDFDVTPELTYYYAVSAVGPAGEGAPCAPVRCAVSIPGALPGSPENVSATYEGGRVLLHWSAPSVEVIPPVQEYRIYKGLDRNVAFIGATSGLGYVDAQIVRGGSYFYSVSAASARGEGPLSAVINVSASGPPGPVRRLTAVPAGGRNLLTWSAPLDDGGGSILQYNIYRGRSPGSLVYCGNTTGRAFSDGAPGGGTYFYGVAAVNPFGEGNLTTVKAEGGPPESFAGAGWSTAALGMAVVLAACALAYAVLSARKRRKAGSPPDDSNQAQGKGAVP